MNDDRDDETNFTRLDTGPKLIGFRPDTGPDLEELYRWLEGGGS